MSLVKDGVVYEFNKERQAFEDKEGKLLRGLVEEKTSILPLANWTRMRLYIDGLSHKDKKGSFHEEDHDIITYTTGTSCIGESHYLYPAEWNLGKRRGSYVLMLARLCRGIETD